MNLSPGSRVGPYEIVSRIGAGGMGEVWRATDPRIGRDVAIKILPPSFSSAPDRIARFEQEARATGTLNHPNLVTIHEFGEHENFAYIAMELLEGDTLRERLTPAGTRIPLRKAVDYGTQITQGLAAAHDKDIIHRDLKPENIFITRDGRVKILDFGLAKLKVASGNDSHTEMRGTNPGTVLGTAGYMSPEQVRGEAVDHRSDIFSFGAIFYEMLSGRQAFRGKSAADTLSAILREEPEPLSDSTPQLSPGIDRIARHCLEKNAEERFQSARDIAFDLGALSAESGARVSAAPARPLSRRWWIFAGAAIALLAIGAGAGYVLRPRNVAPNFRQITFRRGSMYSARFAPDGHSVVYSAKWKGGPLTIYSASAESPESRALIPNAKLLAMSPQGEMATLLDPQFWFHQQWEGTLARAPVAGGSPRKLLDHVLEADWNHDGSRLAIVRNGGSERTLEYPPGTVLYKTDGWIGALRISPQDDAIAIFDQPQFGDDRGSVAVVDLHGQKKTLSSGFESEEGLAWTRDGSEIWFTASTSGASLKLFGVDRRGRTRQIFSTPGGVVLHDIGTDGRVVMARETHRMSTMGVLAGTAGEQDLTWLDATMPADLSSDGKSILLSEQGEAGGNDYAVCLRQAGSEDVVRLGNGMAVSLSPDGAWALTRPPEGGEFTLLPTGAGEPRKLPTPAVTPRNAAAWRADGKSIVFAGNQPGRPNRLFEISTGGGPPRPLGPEGSIIFGPSPRLLSPDAGTAVILQPGVGSLLLRLDDGQLRKLPGITADEFVVGWAGQDTLYVREGTRFPARIDRYDLATGKRTLWKVLTPADPSGVESINSVVISPDGKYYAYSYTTRASDLFIADGLR